MDKTSLEFHSGGAADALCTSKFVHLSIILKLREKLLRLNGGSFATMATGGHETAKFINRFHEEHCRDEIYVYGTCKALEHLD